MSPKAKKESLPDEIEAHVNEVSDLLLGAEGMRGISDGMQGPVGIIGPTGVQGCCGGPTGVTGPMCHPGLPGAQGRPKTTSPEWNDYVLSFLLEDEWREDKNGKKNPTTDGLTRVAEELFGELYLDIDLVQSPNAENGMVATARCIIEAPEYHTKRHVKEIADATPENNAEYPFSKYLTAIAGTRAQGRAVRKFLRLRKVVTAEEVGSDPVDTEKKAVMTQVNVLKKMGEQYDINVWAFINKYLKEKWGNKVFNYINEVPYDFMLEPILSNIQKYQQKDKDGNMVQVPPDLKGYDPNFIQERWKS